MGLVPCLYVAPPTISVYLYYASGITNVSNFSLLDSNGVNVTPPQDTPVSNRKDGNFIIFGIDVEIPKAMEKLPRGEERSYTKNKVTNSGPFDFILEATTTERAFIPLEYKPTLLFVFDFWCH